MAARPPELGPSLQQFGLARDRMRAALAKHVGVSETDLDALEYLEAEGPLTQRELGQRLSLTSGAITMLADRMEAAGWVKRRPHPDDRRYIVLELSSKAVQAAPAALDEYHGAVRALIAGLPAAHRSIVATFLDAAAGAATEAAGNLAR
jgi:DNA-binding MarR family transcriptional regulator